MKMESLLIDSKKFEVSYHCHPDFLEVGIQLYLKIGGLESRTMFVFDLYWHIETNLIWIVKM